MPCRIGQSRLDKEIMKCLIILLLFAYNAAIKGDLGEPTLGSSEANPANSCNEIYQHNVTSRGTIGQYYIKTCYGAQLVTCNMKLKCGGIEGGWMQVVDVDMDQDDACPGSWEYTLNPRKLCQGNDAGCSSAHFSVKGVKYDQICGQARAYEKGTPSAFSINIPSIDSHYVDGVSITIGLPRKHVWTYAVGLSDDSTSTIVNCPCSTTAGRPPPAFVGNNYYCESGDVGGLEFPSYYLSDPLWDGAGCSVGDGCCAQVGMPWFHRSLTTSESEDFEVRICKDQAHSDEDIAIEKLEIYVLSS